MLVSECCGATPQGFSGPHGTIDCDSTDFGICPDCKDHCEFIDDGDMWEPPDPETKVFRAMEGGTDGG